MLMSISAILLMIVVVSLICYLSNIKLILVIIIDGNVDCAVEDVLVFVPGSSRIPPLGFDTMPTLSFIKDGGILATASTCDIQLRIPVIHKSYERFREAILLSIKGHDGFGTTYVS